MSEKRACCLSVAVRVCFFFLLVCAFGVCVCVFFAHAFVSAVTACPRRVSAKKKTRREKGKIPSTQTHRSMNRAYLRLCCPFV